MPNENGNVLNSKWNLFTIHLNHLEPGGNIIVKDPKNEELSFPKTEIEENLEKFEEIIIIQKFYNPHNNNPIKIKIDLPSKGEKYEWGVKIKRRKCYGYLIE